ncbi:hypothetical protein, partial [Candidatus Nitrosarchaeum limnium]
IEKLYSQGIPNHGPTQTKSIDEILKEIEQEAGLHAQNNILPLEEQLSFSDTLTYSHSQAQDITNPSILPPLNSLQEQLSLSDTLTFSHSQAQNSTFPILQIIPILEPTKGGYSMTEEPEIVLEFYDESQALQLELNDIELILNLVESAGEPTQDSPNSLGLITDFIGILLFKIPSVDAAKPENLKDTKDIAKDNKSSDKAKIKQLKNEIKQLKQDKTLSTDEIKDLKSKLKILALQLKETKQNAKLNSEITKIEKLANEFKETQKDNWNGNKETITAEIFDSKNNKVNLAVEFVKQREGKFNIKIDPLNAKPGIYKIKTILNVNGNQFVSESQFAWGLVSVNSMKSIYKPTETAKFEIVILNATGNPVCPANVLMQIIAPNLQSTTLSSNDIVEDSCGLYTADYPTSVTGNYTINVQADTGNGIANFETYFTVLDKYDYDIIRYTPSKIDPFTEPNDFDVEIDITSFVGNNELTIRDYVPSSFNIFNTDATVETIGNQKVITWHKTPKDGFVDTLVYSYSVPLITPELYPLGKITIDQSGIPTFTEARNWFVAVDPQFLVSTDVSTIDDKWQNSNKRIVAINSTHLYSFYLDGASDLHYDSSTNGGYTWTTGADLYSPDTGISYNGMGVWYEPSTPGRTNKVIHIAAFDSG